MPPVKYVVEDMDRHGNVRLYVRRRGHIKVRLHEAPGTPEFSAEYRAALKQQEAGVKPGKPEIVAPGSLRWLCERYYQGAQFLQLGAGTRKVRRAILDRICENNGTGPIARMEPRHIGRMRDARIDAPEAANAIVKALRQVFAWAMLPEVSLAERNPARDVPYLDSDNPDGFHTWTVEEVAQYLAHHKVGTKAALALALLLFTGVRRSDVVRFGPGMATNGNFRWTEFKGRKRTPKHRELPILAELQTFLEASPLGDKAYLETEFGKPFTANGFGNWFRKRCDEAKLPQCSAHGLRKAGATIAAENGATEQQLMAIYGWESAKQAGVYTRKANKKRLAEAALHLVVPGPNGAISVPLFPHQNASGTHSGEKP